GPGSLGVGVVGRIAREELPADLVGRVMPSLAEGVVHVAKRFLRIPRLARANLEHPCFLLLRHAPPPPFTGRPRAGRRRGWPRSPRTGYSSAPAQTLHGPSSR